MIDTATRKIVATLTDEHGRAVQSEKMLEIDFEGDQPVRNGDQFGLARYPARGDPFACYGVFLWARCVGGIGVKPVR